MVLMMKMIFSITVILILQFLICAKCQIPCYQTLENPPKSLFGSMSPYPNKSTIKIPEGCKPIQLWFFSRHGTRHPALPVILNMKSLTQYKDLINKTTNMCQEDKDALNNWEPTLNDFDAKELNSQGRDDLKSLGKRVRKTFFQLFNTSYNPSDFQVLSTRKARCVYTAKYFLNALFNDIVIKDIDEVPTYENEDIRLDYSKGLLSKPNDTIKWEDQVQKFKNSSHVKSVVQSVAHKMNKDDLDIKEVLVMFDACQYEKTWHLASRPAWCAFFSEKDFEVLEYLDDLHRYYFNSYGNSYNERFGCPLVKDIIENFKQKVEKLEGPRGVFYFGHSSNLLSLITRLGIFKDAEPITADNYEKMKDNRKFRGSSIDSFASNMIVALYKCDDDDYKVSFYENEKPVKIGGDKGCYVCPWKDLEQHLDPITSDKKCLFEDETNSASVSYVAFYLLLLCFCITYIY